MAEQSAERSRRVDRIRELLFQPAAGHAFNKTSRQRRLRLEGQKNRKTSGQHFVRAGSDERETRGRIASGRDHEISGPPRYLVWAGVHLSGERRFRERNVDPAKDGGLRA